MSSPDRLRLHSGAPFWLLNDGLEELAAPVSPCDVAIIGAGITGALLADRLTEAGLRVMGYDRRALGYGGNGIPFSLVAADLLRDHCLGIQNEDARIFRLDR